MGDVGGVAHQDVELWPFLPQPRRERRLAGHVARVAEDGQERAVQLPGGLIQPFLGAAGNRDSRALGEELTGGRKPDTARPARDQCVLSLKTSHRTRSPHSRQGAWFCWRRTHPSVRGPARGRLPRCGPSPGGARAPTNFVQTFNKCSAVTVRSRSEEHTSELQSRGHLVCRLLLV